MVWASTSFEDNGIMNGSRRIYLRSAHILAPACVFRFICMHLSIDLFAQGFTRFVVNIQESDPQRCDNTLNESDPQKGLDQDVGFRV